MAKEPELTERVRGQIAKAGLPTAGAEPFIPALTTDSRKRQALVRAAVRFGPKAGKVGYVDAAGRIWIRDRAHADVPDHWDVQVNGGESYFRVGEDGNRLP